MNKKIFLPALSLLALCSQQVAAWQYQGSDGPVNWGKEAAICEQGKNQSPIDIHDIVHSQMPTLKLNYAGQTTALRHTGHGLQASIKGKNTLVVDHTPFKLVQFHFHTPAEHQVKGQHYPMEVHFVHADAKGNLAVVAQFFTLGEQDPLLDQLLGKPIQKGQTHKYAHTFGLNQWFPTALKSYYRYNGSLTTPPCSEGVRWFIDPTPRHLTQTQLKQWQKAMGANSRPLQPYYARRVLGD